MKKEKFGWNFIILKTGSRENEILIVILHRKCSINKENKII